MGIHLVILENDCGSVSIRKVMLISIVSNSENTTKEVITEITYKVLVDAELPYLRRKI